MTLTVADPSDATRNPPRRQSPRLPRTPRSDPTERSLDTPLTKQRRAESLCGTALFVSAFAAVPLSAGLVRENQPREGVLPRCRGLLAVPHQIFITPTLRVRDFSTISPLLSANSRAWGAGPDVRAGFCPVLASGRFIADRAQEGSLISASKLSNFGEMSQPSCLASNVQAQVYAYAELLDVWYSHCTNMRQ